MRVSTFFAATLPEGMAKVREALGPKAVVLSWRNVRGGVEISASVQSSEAEPVREPAQRPMKQQDALSDHFSPSDFKLEPAPAPVQRNAKPAPARGLAALVSRNTNAPPIRQAPTPAVIRTAAPVVPPQQRSQSARPTSKPPAPNRSQPAIQTTKANATKLTSFLMRAGLSPEQCTTFGNGNSNDLSRDLTASLANALKFDPIDAIPSKPILLVGPPGSGKSACAAKLAARTLSGGHQVLLISADAERCGGADQLRALATRLGARFETVTNLVDLTNLVTAARQRGMVVYVDAPSACPAQPSDMRATARMIAETRLEPVLCLPADMRADDMEELASAYKAIGVKRVIATRLDLTTRRASVLYVANKTGLALAQFSATPYISGGVAMATPARLAAMLLEAFEDALLDNVREEDAA